jgi:ankyrin repeat protein
MLAIIVLLFGAFCGAATMLGAGVPVVILHQFRLLPFDRRIWWTLMAVVGWLVVKDLINASYKYSPPTASPEKFYFQAHLLGGQAGIVITFLVGLIVLTFFGRSNLEEPIRIWLAYPLAALVAVCGLIVVSYVTVPVELKRANYESKRREFVDAITDVDIEKLSTLLRRGAAMDDRYDELGDLRPLDYAIQEQNQPLIELLLNPPNGRAPKVGDNRFKSILKTENLDILEAFLRGKHQQSRLGSALRAAVAIPNRPLIQLLLEKGADPGAQDEFDTPLTICAAQNSVPIAEELIRRGADVNTFHGSPDLNRGSTALVTAVDHGHSEMVDLLLENGAAVNRTNATQRSALQAACRAGHVEIAKRLIDARADVNYRNGSRGYTALHWTIYARDLDDSTKLRIVELLLDSKADPDLTDKRGNSARSIAGHRDADDAIAILLRNA